MEEDEKTYMLHGGDTIVNTRVIQRPTWDEKEGVKKSAMLVRIKNERFGIDEYLLIRAKIKKEADA